MSYSHELYVSGSASGASNQNGGGPVDSGRGSQTVTPYGPILERDNVTVTSLGATNYRFTHGAQNWTGVQVGDWLQVGEDEYIARVTAIEVGGDAKVIDATAVWTLGTGAGKTVIVGGAWSTYAKVLAQVTAFWTLAVTGHLRVNLQAGTYVADADPAADGQAAKTITIRGYTTTAGDTQDAVAILDAEGAARPAVSLTKDHWRWQALTFNQNAGGSPAASQPAFEATGACEGAYWQYCRFRNGDTVGLDIQGLGCAVEDSEAVDCVGYGFELSGAGSIARGIYAHGCGTGIRLIGTTSYGCILANAVTAYNSARGLVVTAGGGKSSRIVISNLTAVYNGTHGVELDGFQPTAFLDALIARNGGKGMNVASGSPVTRLRGVRWYNNSGGNLHSSIIVDPDADHDIVTADPIPGAASGDYRPAADIRELHGTGQPAGLMIGGEWWDADGGTDLGAIQQATRPVRIFG